MQDSDILPDYWAYMFRYDVPDDEKSLTEELHTYQEIMLELPFLDYYLAGFEFSKKTQKPHIQSIVWSNHKLSQNNMQKARNLILKKYKWDVNKGKVAFSSAKKVRSLSAYSQKDKNTVTNLPADILELIPQWRPWEDISKDKKALLERNLKKYKLCTLDFRKFAQIMNLEYQNVYGNPCNRRNIYYTFAYKLGIIDNENYLERIGVIPPVYRSYETICTHISDDYKKNKKI